MSVYFSSGRVQGFFCGLIWKGWNFVAEKTSVSSLWLTGKKSGSERVLRGHAPVVSWTNKLKTLRCLIELEQRINWSYGRNGSIYLHLMFIIFAATLLHAYTSISSGAKQIINTAHSYFAICTWLKKLQLNSVFFPYISFYKLQSARPDTYLACTGWTAAAALLAVNTGHASTCCSALALCSHTR